MTTPNSRSIKQYFVSNRNTESIWSKNRKKPNIRVFDNKYQTSSTLALDYLISR